MEEVIKNKTSNKQKIKNKNQKEHIYKALKPILPGLFYEYMYLIRLHTVYWLYTELYEL